MRLLPLLLLAMMLTPSVALAAGDEPPALVGAVTGGAGMVERVVLRFDAPIELGSVGPGDFALTGCGCAPTDVVLAGSEVHLAVGVADTAWTPQVTYTAPADGLQSPGGTPVASLSVKAADATPPVPISATAWGIGRSDAVLMFSEPVSWKGNLAEGLTRSDLDFDDAAAAGATAIDGVIHPGKSARIDLVLRGGFAAADDGVDGIRVLADAVADAAGNVATTTRLPLVLDRMPPAAVADLKATVAGSSSIAIQLTVPADEDVERIEVRFDTEVFAPEEFETKGLVNGAPSRVTPAQAVKFDVTGLEPGQHHYFAALAIDRNGNRGPLSDVVAATTLRDTFPPAAPGALQVPVGGLGTRWLGLSWTAPADHDGTPVDRYEIRIATGSVEDPAAGEFVAPPIPAAPGLIQRFMVTDVQPGQLYTITMRSIDGAGNLSPWARVEATTATDESPPEGVLKLTSATHVHGVPSEKSVLDIEWSGVTDPHSPIVYLYEISRDPFSRVDWTSASTEQTRLTGHVLGNGRWHVHVAALSAGGMVEAELFEVVVSREAPPPPPAPKLVKEGYGELTVDVHMPPEADSVELRWALQPITDDTWGQATPAGRGPGQLTVAPLPPETEIHLAAKATDAAGRSSDVSPNLMAVPLMDPSPPSGLVALSSWSHEDPSSSRRIEVEWTPAIDNETAVTYHVALHRDADALVTIDDEATTDVAASLEVEYTGEWYVHVRPRSMGGWGEQQTLALMVLPPSPKLMALASAVPVSVERVDGANVVSWELPPELHDAMGLQLWVANSPYEVIQAVTSDDEGFTAGSFEHRGDDARASSRYLVTAYFTLDAAGGHYSVADPPSSTLHGVAPAQHESTAWLARAAWIFVAVVLVGGAAVGAWAGWRAWSRRKAEAEVEAENPPWTGPSQDSEWEQFNGELDDGWAMDEEEIGLDSL